jgi:hypothetical protein
MTIYVVQAHAPDEESLMRARFIPQSFSIFAALFGPLWLLYHRLWGGVLAWLAAEAAFVVFALPHVGAGVAIMMDLMARLYLGVEGNALRVRRTPLIEVVDARNASEAETIFYRRRFDREQAASD